MGLQERIDALQPRERRLLSVFVGLFVVICVLLIPVGISAMLADKRSQNEELQNAIDRMFAERDEVQERSDANARILSRYKTDTPPLAGLIDKHAKELEIEIPEFKERPPAPQGKKYEERATEFSIKKVGMRNLVLFMEKLAKLSYPVSITKLNIRKRTTEPDSWDVTMTVSSYHRLEQEKKSAKPAVNDDDAAEE